MASGTCMYIPVELGLGYADALRTSLTPQVCGVFCSQWILRKDEKLEKPWGNIYMGVLRIMNFQNQIWLPRWQKVHLWTSLKLLTLLHSSFWHVDRVGEAGSYRKKNCWRVQCWRKRSLHWSCRVCAPPTWFSEWCHHWHTWSPLGRETVRESPNTAGGKQAKTTRGQQAQNGSSIKSWIAPHKLPNAWCPCTHRRDITHLWHYK